MWREEDGEEDGVNRVEGNDSWSGPHKLVQVLLISKQYTVNTIYNKRVWLNKNREESSRNTM